MRIVAYKGQYRITIPKDLAESKGWKPGTRIRFIEDISGNVCLKVIDETRDKARERMRRRIIRRWRRRK